MRSPAVTDLGEAGQLRDGIDRDRCILTPVELDKRRLAVKADDNNPAFFPRIRSDAVAGGEDNSI